MPRSYCRRRQTGRRGRQREHSYPSGKEPLHRPPRRSRADRASGWRIGRAPEPHRAAGDGSSKSLVVMGDPASVRTSGSRTEVRHCPSTRIPSPSHAAAAACLATSGPPALRHPPRRASPDTRARPGSLPVTRDTSRHDLVATETPDSSSGGAAIPRRRGSPGRCWHAPVRALQRTWRTVPLRCVDRLLLRNRSGGTWGARRRPSHDAGPSGPATPPRRRQRDCCEKYQPVITPASRKRLADPLPPLARGPILRPVTTGFPPRLERTPHRSCDFLQ